MRSYDVEMEERGFVSSGYGDGDGVGLVVKETGLYYFTESQKLT